MNWKNKKVIGGLLAVVLMGFGIGQPQVLSTVGTELICNAVECE